MVMMLMCDASRGQAAWPDMPVFIIAPANKAQSRATNSHCPCPESLARGTGEVEAPGDEERAGGACTSSSGDGIVMPTTSTFPPPSTTMSTLPPGSTI